MRPSRAWRGQIASLDARSFASLLAHSIHQLINGHTRREGAKSGISMRSLDRRRAVTEGYMDSRSLQCTPHLRDCLAGVRRRLRSAPYDGRGFSLPELLLVCVIVGVPAAIAIRSFASQKDKALDTQAKALARAAQTAAETIGTD